MGYEFKAGKPAPKPETVSPKRRGRGPAKPKVVSEKTSTEKGSFPKQYNPTADDTKPFKGSF